jgi:hypothetical protein
MYPRQQPHVVFYSSLQLTRASHRHIRAGDVRARESVIKRLNRALGLNLRNWEKEVEQLG